MVSCCYEKKYINRSHVSEKKFRLIIKYFSLDLNTVQIAKLTELSRQSINKHWRAVSKIIATYCYADTASFSGHKFVVLNTKVNLV